jgi:hypothetical protein
MIQFVPHSKHSASATRTNQLIIIYIETLLFVLRNIYDMTYNNLYRKIAVCPENHV